MSSLFGGGGGLFGGLFGGFRANGGPVEAGKSYVVGERGPEVFTPSSSGQITANNEMGGATNNFYFSALDSMETVEKVKSIVRSDPRGVGSTNLAYQQDTRGLMPRRV